MTATTQETKPQALTVHGSQLRYTMARIKTAGYQVLDVQRDGENYIIVVVMPADAQLPKRTNTSASRRGRKSSIGRTLRGIGSGLIVIAFGVAALGPASAMFGTGLGTGLTAAAAGVFASSAILLPAMVIVLAILALLPVGARLANKAIREYEGRR